MFRILIVDDEKDVVDFCSKRLIREGYEVYTASNGQEGLSLALRFVPDLILTDVTMPIMGGFEFCKALKESSKTRDIPVVVITGNAMDVTDAFIYLGVKEVLYKPFNLDHLVEKIKVYLGVSKQLKTQKTKILLQCVRPAKLAATQAVIESVPQWVAKFAITGAELLARAKEFQPDVIVLDLFMNDMAADEAINLIKAVPELQKTQIVTYYSPLTEGDDFIIQARMIEIQYLKTATAAAGALEYLGPLNNPVNFIALLDDYRRDNAGIT